MIRAEMIILMMAQDTTKILAEFVLTIMNLTDREIGIKGIMDLMDTQPFVV